MSEQNWVRQEVYRNETQGKIEPKLYVVGAKIDYDSPSGTNFAQYLIPDPVFFSGVRFSEQPYFTSGITTVNNTVQSTSKTWLPTDQTGKLIVTTPPPVGAYVARFIVPFVAQYVIKENTFVGAFIGLTVSPGTLDSFPSKGIVECVWQGTGYLPSTPVDWSVEV